MRSVIIAVLSVFLASCVSYKSVLVNAEGETTNCNQWGFGILGAPMAVAQHKECIKVAESAGYRQKPPAKKFTTPPLDCSAREKDGKLESDCK